MSCSSRIPLALYLSAACLYGAEITGTVVVERKLTKSKVTATSGSYSRGVSVPLSVDTGVDALSFERAHVVVYLEGKLPSTPTQAAIDQQNRVFTPDLVVVPVGSTVAFPNRDLVFHNVFSLSRTKSFDLGNYPKDQSRSVTFSNPGIAYVNCHLHPNMTAAVVVTPNSWATRADAAGRFTLRDVPPGVYTLVAWHKAVGFFRQTVRLEADTRRSVEFLLPFPAETSLTAAVR